MNLHAFGDSLAAELSRRAALDICLSRLTVDSLRTSSGVDNLTRAAGARARRRLLGDSGGHRLVDTNRLWLLLAADERADDAAAALVAVLVLVVAGGRVRRLAALVRVRGRRGADAGLDASLFALQ